MASSGCRDAAIRALVALIVSLVPARLAAAPADLWLGMYFGGRKIGYTSVASARVTYRGRPAYRVTSHTQTRIDFGQVVSQTIDSVSYSDLRHRPIHQEFRMASGGSTTSVTADYHATTIDCLVDAGSGPSRKQIAIPPGARLLDDSDTGQYFEHNAVGLKTVAYSLNPLTVTLDREEVTIDSKAHVTFDGRDYDAFKVLSDTSMGRIVAWETAAGDLLRAEAPMGITMYAESESAARNMSAAEPPFSVVGAASTPGTGAAYVPPRDFALATSVAANRDIADPRRLGSLSIELEGIDNPRMAISDSRQRASAVPGERGDYRFTISASSFNASDSASLPLKPPAAIASLMQPAPYVDSRAPAIVKRADQLRGGERNAYRVASRIRAWVHRVMRPDVSMGVPRSALEILQHPRGVCRDYAALFAALARAAGIPTRIAGGIVYMGGRFYYHAWDECWVGRWVPFDATLTTDFVDATHIKLAEGGVTEMFQVVDVIGRLKARVLQVGALGSRPHRVAIAVPTPAVTGPEARSLQRRAPLAPLGAEVSVR